MRGVGYGAAITGPNEKLIGAMEYFDPILHSPLAAEVNPLIHGLRLLQRMNISCAIVCSDSTNAVKMIRGDIQPITDVHHWILQIHQLAESFDRISFNLVSRHCNKQADYLAREALAHQRSMLWIGDIPRALISITNFSPCNCKVSCICSK